MSTDARYQAHVLAHYALPRSQQEAWDRLEHDLQPLLEPLPPSTPRDVCDALWAILARPHLNAEQRAALVAPLLAQLTAMQADAPADAPRLRAVPEVG